MSKTQTATFALGCFWAPDAQFGSLDGVHSTRVGYAGGTSPSPTYYEIGDHAECVEVVFDPEVVGYQALLERFWEWHNAFRKPYARQYMSAVLCHDEAQRDAVERDIARMQIPPRKVHTEVLPYTGMTWAEDYHQKYYLRRDREAALALKGLFPEYESFVNSAAAMRVNAILAGYLQLSAEELAALGLPEPAIASLLKPKRSIWQKMGSLLKA